MFGVHSLTQTAILQNTEILFCDSVEGRNGMPSAVATHRAGVVCAAASVQLEGCRRFLCQGCLLLVQHGVANLNSV